MHGIPRRSIRLAGRAQSMAPLYARALRERHLQDLILVRRSLGDTLDEADQIVAETIVALLERRLADEIELMLVDE
jgi:hypothetical protein